MAFEVKWRTVCESCDEDILQGQEAEYTAARRLVHANFCPVDLDALTGKPRPVCPQCFLTLPVSGDCECRE